MFKIFKKLVLVLATSILVIKTSKEDDIGLERIFCIYCLFWFKKNKVRVLSNFSNKLNTMTLGYTLKLSLKIYFINIKDQKIDDSIHEMF